MPDPHCLRSETDKDPDLPVLRCRALKDRSRLQKVFGDRAVGRRHPARPLTRHFRVMELGGRGRSSPLMSIAGRTVFRKKYAGYGNYFPMQNPENSRSRTSSTPT